jgi:hypothetical protein
MVLSCPSRVAVFVLCLLHGILPAQSEGTDDWNAPLVSLHTSGSYVFASNRVGIFRAELETRQWQQLSLPSGVPLGGKFGDVPEGSEILLYIASRSFGSPVGENNYGLYLSPDAGATWSLISKDGRYGAAILLPNGSLFAAKSMGSFSQIRSSVHVSKDMGRSWRDITGKTGYVGAIFPDPDHPGQICLRVESRVLQADDEQYHWKSMHRREWHPEHAQTTRFFSRSFSTQTSLYVLQATLNNYFHYEFANRASIPALDLKTDASRISVTQGQPVLVPITIRFLQDLRVYHWLWEQRSPSFEDSPEPTLKTVKLLDSPSSNDLWGIRIDFDGQRTAKQSRSSELVDNSKDRDATQQQILESATWNDITLSATTPYRRRLDLSRLHDFSRPGTYTVQLTYDNYGVAERSKGYWVGSFSSPVFEVVVGEKK